MTAADHDHPWMDRSLCSQIGGDVFFPAPGESTVREAKAMCAACEVREECLAYALGRDDEGIWGGLARHERRKLRRGAA